MQNLLMKVSRVAEQVADINGLLVAEVSMTCGWKWEVLLSVPVIALLGCGAPRERCLDPDVCDDLMTVVGLPLTHEWRGSAEFEFDGVVHTYAEVHYSGSGDLPGATMCLLWDSALGQGRVVYWTSAFNVPGFVGCPSGELPDLVRSCAYPDGLGGKLGSDPKFTTALIVSAGAKFTAVVDVPSVVASGCDPAWVSIF